MHSACKTHVNLRKHFPDKTVLDDACNKCRRLAGLPLIQRACHSEIGAKIYFVCIIYNYILISKYCSSAWRVREQRLLLYESLFQYEKTVCCS